MQLKDVAGSLFELWKLMDTTREERRKLSRIISFLDISESKVVEPGALTLEVIQQVCKHFLPLNFSLFLALFFFPLYMISADSFVGLFFQIVIINSSYIYIFAERFDVIFDIARYQQKLGGLPS